MRCTHLLLATLCCAPLVAATTGWTGWRGPFGNGCAPDIDAQMIDDWSQVEALWTSTEQIPGTYEGDARKPKSPVDHRIPAGYASPVVADGMVYLAYYVPNGPVYDVEVTRRHASEGGFGRAAWYTDADEVVLAIDAATGETRWRRVFPEQTFNLEAGFNKGGCQLTPCVVDGRVFALGPSGHLVALDSATGAVLWHGNTGIRAVYNDDFQAGSREEGTLRGHRNDFAGCVMVSGGTVAVSDHQEYKGGPRTMANGGNGLVGFDCATGRRLWYVPAAGGRGMLGSTPLAWRHDGADYFIAAGNAGVQLIGAADGTVHWTEAAAVFDNAAAIDGDRLICKGTDKGVGLLCYQISAAGATERWRVGHDPGFVSPVVWQDHCYLLADKALLCLSMADGSVVARLEHEQGCSSLVCQNGLIAVASTNRGRAGLSLIRADPTDLSLVARADVPFANSTTAAWHQGILYIRGRDRVHAYDCRR